MNLISLAAPALLVVCLMLVTGAGVAGAAEALPEVDHWPSVTELPDPFLSVDGSHVKNADDWKKRREELQGLILGYEYGPLPPKGADVTGSEPTSKPFGTAGAIRQQIELSMGPDHKLKVPLTLTLPAAKGPFPVIVNGDLCWGIIKPEVLNEMLSRGYAFAQFDRTVIADDSADRSKGIYPLYPDADCGRLAAWAWGYSRVVDYLLTRPEIDAAKVTISGHSRGGKCVLVAGATDERIALTVPNGSGCGGAGCYRVNPPRTETIDIITSHFPYWFVPTFKGFIGNVDRLPFDQHELKALVAPRALLTTDATGDVWANAPGTQATFQAAQVVYDFLGAKQNIGIHYRAGGHEQNQEDWTALLDFADQLYFNKKSPQSFEQLPVPDAPTYFTWKAPTQ